MRVYLIGFMGCGKSTLGQRLAEENVWLKKPMAFCDLDAVIEEQQGRTVKDIFQNDGDDAFRIAEDEALRATGEKMDCIVALGGGTPCKDANLDWILENGKCIFIDVPVDVLYDRMINGFDKRPMLAQVDDDDRLNFMDALLEQRREFYSEADEIVEGDQSFDSVLLEISDIINDWLAEAGELKTEEGES